MTRRLEYGDPADVILNVADEVRTEVVVMGARGLSPVKELLLVSVSHAVVNHIAIPILIVSHPLPELHHVLVAIEGQSDADKIVSFLARRPFKEAVEMTVLCVPLLPKEVFAPEAEIKILEEKEMAMFRMWVCCWVNSAINCNRVLPTARLPTRVALARDRGR